MITPSIVIVPVSSTIVRILVKVDYVVQVAVVVIVVVVDLFHPSQYVVASQSLLYAVVDRRLHPLPHASMM